MYHFKGKKSQAVQQSTKNDPGSSKTSSYDQLMLIKNSLSDSSDEEEKNRPQKETGLASTKTLPSKPVS